MTAINVHCTSNLCKFLFPQKKKTQAERVSTKVSTCYISIIVWVEWTHTYNSFFLLISSKRWYWIARHLPQCIPLLRWWRLNRLTWTMVVDSLVIEKFLNTKMIIAGNYATMQLPIESLKNIQAFYLFIPKFQNMKFIYSSLQRKSCSRCCSYTFRSSGYSKLSFATYVIDTDFFRKVPTGILLCWRSYYAPA